MSHPLFDTHQELLDNAVNATRNRTYWSAYPEIPSGKIYGETARTDGQNAYQARLNQPFKIDQPGAIGYVGNEISPFTNETLGITYPKTDLNILFPAILSAIQSWKTATIETRTGVCLEILHRLNARSFEMAPAVMHTTGQGSMMAFQAGGPHAQDRGLEALAYAYQAMKEIPPQATWRKKVARDETITLNKTFRLVPRGIALTIACSTFPNWNSYPGIFASLATGNAVIVKPHPGAILPLAITVETARAVFREQGFDPNLITLVADTNEEPVAKTLATRNEIKIIDYTGSTQFGNWLEENARSAIVYTEKAGINSIIIDSLENLKAVSGNLAFSLALYSGQMCTTSQNIFIPRDGIETTEGRKSFDEIANAIVKSLDWFLAEPQRAAEVLGAIQNENTVNRINESRTLPNCTILRDSDTMANEAFPNARVHSPLILRTDAANEENFMSEVFGPITFIIATNDTNQSIELAAKAAREQGAITCALYSTNPDIITQTEEATAEAGVPLSCNLTGSIWVNQSAAFSDYHVSGSNPAGNATLCDTAYVANRFRIIQSRIPAPIAVNT